jgi:hypothetical protein
LQATFLSDGQALLDTRHSEAAFRGEGQALLDTSVKSNASQGEPISRLVERFNASTGIREVDVHYSTGTVVRTLYLVDNGGNFNGGKTEEYGGQIDVEMGKMYDVKVEVLRDDLGQASEYMKKLMVDGTDRGECHPDGNDYDCTFFDCGMNFVVGPTISASVKIQLTMTGHSHDCDCDQDTATCSKQDTVAGRTPIKAAARFTLTPQVTDGPVTKVIYLVDDSRNGEDENFGGQIMVSPQTTYKATVEVLRDDLGGASEYVKAIRIGGVSMGECHPSGGDYDCTWHTCYSDQEIYAYHELMDASFHFKGHSCDCLCDTTSWQCADERTTSSGNRIKAAVRVTLHPVPTTTTTKGPPDPPHCYGDCR